jgi:hypothetical protein
MNVKLKQVRIKLEVAQRHYIQSGRIDDYQAVLAVLKECEELAD